MGVQAFPTDALAGKGVERVVDGVVAAYEEREHTSRHVHVEYGSDIENAINNLLDEVAKIPNAEFDMDSSFDLFAASESLMGEM